MNPLSSGVSRRAFLRWGLVAAGSGLLVACGQPAAPAAPAAKDAAKPAAPAAAAPTNTPAVQVAVPTPALAAKPADAAKPAEAAKPAAAAPPTAAPAAKPAEAAKPAANIKRGGILKAHRQNDWPTLDPHTTQTSSLDMILSYDYLTRVERNAQTQAWEVKPALAESWDLPDPQTVVFKLRPNVKFHDGTPCDAEAIKWNFNRMMTHPKTAAKVITAPIDTVEVVDPLTVRLKLKTPSSTLFVNLSSDADNVAGIMSPTWAQAADDQKIATSAVGTGPYRVAEYQPSNQIIYKKFDQYWKMGADGKPLPYPDEVHVKYQQDWNAALVALRTGDIDLMSGVAGRDVPTIESDPNLRVERAPWNATMYMMAFNARPGARFHGDNMKKVRQAILYAIDREAIATALGAGIGSANYYHLTPGQIGFNDKLPKYEYNPDKSKQLLSEAGYASGIDVTVDIISRPEDQQNAQAYQQMLEKVGVRMQIRPSERVAWVQKTLAGDFEMGTLLSGVRPDPDLVFGYRFVTGGSGNYMGWSHPEVDKLIGEGRTVYEQPKRQEIYEKLQTIIADEAYLGFMWRRQGIIAMNKAVEGYIPPWGGYFINSPEVWLNR